jgi:hypothetical protein
MARFEDDQQVLEALRPHVPAGETVQHFAYGVQQPPPWAIALLYLLTAIIPGAIVVALLTKEYLVATTERRLLVVRFTGGRIKVKQVLDYPLDRLRAVKSSKDRIFTHIAIPDPTSPFAARFHRLGMKQNQAHAEAMADLLQQSAGASAA